MIVLLDEGYRGGAAGRLAGQEVRYFPSDLHDPDAFAALLANVDAVGFMRMRSFPLDGRVLGESGRLKFIQKSGSGADWFDLDFLSALGILVGLNTGFNAIGVAEHALTLALLCLRRTRDFADVITGGKWMLKLPGEEPMLFFGKTVGVVGIGASGSHLARMAQGLGARVIFYHPNPAAKAPPGTAWADLDTLLYTADVISLHVPLRAETTHMIGAREIGLMKPTAVLVNTSRGGVIDQRALVEALAGRRIRAAGLDVFEDEPLPPGDLLRSLPNVVATPHIGGAAQELEAMQVEGTIANLERFAAGLAPERLINAGILADGRARAGLLAAAP